MCCALCPVCVCMYVCISPQNYAQTRWIAPINVDCIRHRFSRSSMTDTVQLELELADLNRIFFSIKNSLVANISRLFVVTDTSVERFYYRPLPFCFYWNTDILTLRFYVRTYIFSCWLHYRFFAIFTRSKKSCSTDLQFLPFYYYYGDVYYCEKMKKKIKISQKYPLKWQNMITMKELCIQNHNWIEDKSE